MSFNGVKMTHSPTLTHWRELTVKCGRKRLCIYPDGGFINEWNIARQPNGERFEV